MANKFKNNLNKKGFTIIELMIAIVIFSIVMLVLTQNIISLSGDYYRGVIESQTISVTKNIITTVTQNIQLNSGSAPYTKLPLPSLWSHASPNNGCVTIGSSVYVYQIGGYVVKSSPSPNYQASGALELVNSNGCPSPTMDFTNSNFSSLQATDLIPQNMRLLKFSITQASPFTKLYKVDVKVAYGNDNAFDINTKKCLPRQYLCAVSEIVAYAYNN